MLFLPVGDRSSRKAIEEKTAKIAKDLEQEQTEETERVQTEGEKSFEQKAAKFTKVMNELCLSAGNLCELCGLLFKPSLLPFV